jgi:XRE family transcriptional regulator, regulator of sulfur utilization
MDIRRRFGTRIRYLRTQHHWTQEQLAEHASLAPKYVGRIERGEVCPSIRVLEQLANGFEVPVHQLVRMPDGATPSPESLTTELSSMQLKQIRSVLALLQRLFNGK